MKHWKRIAFATALLAIMASVTGCTRSIAARTDGGPPFCLAVPEPFRASDRDTQETRDQAAVLNALWERWCE